MPGLNPEPGASYSLIDRFTCVKCGATPKLVKCEGQGPYVITVKCHGEEHTGQYERQELTFDQRVFADGAEEE